MEIREIANNIISQDLSSFGENENLISVLTKIEGLSIEQIFNPSVDLQELIFIWQYLWEEVCKQDIKKQIIAQYINSARRYLYAALSRPTLQKAIIFCAINAQLGIPIEKYSVFFQKQDADKLADEVIKYLNRSKVQLRENENIPIWEQRMLDKFKSGCNDSNIKDVYDFVNSVERGGRGWNGNYLFNQLLCLTKELSANKFTGFVANLSDPIMVIIRLSELNTETLNYLSGQQNISNKWLNFEIIRKISQHSRQNYTDNEIRTIVNCLGKIEVSYPDFYLQTVDYFNNEMIFNEALGSYLHKLSEDMIIETCSVLEINKYMNKSESRKKLLYALIKSEISEQKFDIFLKFFVVKWNELFSTIEKSQEEHLLQLFLTDYMEFVCYYYANYLNDEQLVYMINESLSIIEDIPCRWAINQYHHKNIYILYVSKLFLLSFAYKCRDDIPPVDSAKIMAIINSDIYKMRFCDDNIEANIDIVKDNFTAKKKDTMVSR